MNKVILSILTLLLSFSLLVGCSGGGNETGNAGGDSGGSGSKSSVETLTVEHEEWGEISLSYGKESGYTVIDGENYKYVIRTSFMPAQKAEIVKGNLHFILGYQVYNSDTYGQQKDYILSRDFKDAYFPVEYGGFAGFAELSEEDGKDIAVLSFPSPTESAARMVAVVYEGYIPDDIGYAEAAKKRKEMLELPEIKAVLDTLKLKD